MDRIISYVFVAVLLGGWISPTLAAEQSQILFSIPPGPVRVGSVTTVDVLLDSHGEHINAADISVAYDPALLDVQAVTREQSAFTLWPELPRIDQVQGRVVMAGGRPGGLIAARAKIATLHVVPKTIGAASVSIIAPTAVSLHDGQGTQQSVPMHSVTLRTHDPLLDRLVLSSTTHPREDVWGRTGQVQIHWDPEAEWSYSYLLSTDQQALPDDIPETVTGDLSFVDQADGVYYFTIKVRSPQGVWSETMQRRFLLDQTPPEPFALERISGSFVGGHDILSWTAVDAVSGIDTYELFINGKSQGTVTSPTQIKSDWKGKMIRVLAYDQAGNTQSAQIQFGPAPGAWWNSISLYSALGLLVIIALIVVIMRRRAER